MKQSTAKDYRERLNRVLVFIDRNLDRPLFLEQLAEVASFSPFHFHRIFSAHIGETLHGHVRRLRLERAAQRLTTTAESITDIALMAGFETSAAFARAFREHFSQSPTTFRNSGAKWTATQNAPGVPLAREDGAAIPKPQMYEVDETCVLFVRKTGPYASAAAAAWEKLMRFAYPRRLMTGDTRLIGISHDDPNITAEDRIRYDACISCSGEVRPEGEIGALAIAGGRYAVFPHRGPYDRLGATRDAIFGHWLPASGARLRETPCFEVYLNRDPRRTRPENLRTELWVPVVE